MSTKMLIKKSVNRGLESCLNVAAYGILALVKSRNKHDSEKTGYPNYGRALIAGLKKSRKGKHHDLLSKIMEDLRESAPGFAVRIPLSTTAPTPVVNLRAAIVRTAAKEGISVSTSSDDHNFYVWRAGNRV